MTNMEHQNVRMLKITIPKDARCSHCRKKVLVPMQCLCGLTFCIAHRAAEDHACYADHRKHGQRVLEDTNPKIVAQKVDKI